MKKTIQKPVRFDKLDHAKLMTMADHSQRGFAGMVRYLCTTHPEFLDFKPLKQ